MQNRIKGDLIIKTEYGLIQHGKENDRVYLIKLPPDADVQKTVNYIEKLCMENSYGKSFIKIRSAQLPLFLLNGYRQEAYIPRYFKGEEDCILASRYFNAQRLKFSEKRELLALSKMLYTGKTPDKKKDKDNSFAAVKAEISDSEELSVLYGMIFKNYPFPVQNPLYIKETMESHVDYFIIKDRNKIIGAASAEKDLSEMNAEITDFAVSPEYRGKNLSAILLEAVEKHLAEEGIKTFYTIARLNSIPMNRTFFRGKYTYTGTLINNTNISSGIESMNIWYRHPDPQ